MKDYKDLDREGLMRVLGGPLDDRASAGWKATFWRLVEFITTAVGVFGIGLVALWAFSGILGLYWEVISNGFEAGRAPWWLRGN